MNKWPYNTYQTIPFQANLFPFVVATVQLIESSNIFLHGIQSGHMARHGKTQYMHAAWACIHLSADHVRLHPCLAIDTWKLFCQSFFRMCFKWYIGGRPHGFCDGRKIVPGLLSLSHWLLPQNLLFRRRLRCCPVPTGNRSEVCAKHICQAGASKLEGTPQLAWVFPVQSLAENLSASQGLVCKTFCNRGHLVIYRISEFIALDLDTRYVMICGTVALPFTPSRILRFHATARPRVSCRRKCPTHRCSLWVDCGTILVARWWYMAIFLHTMPKLTGTMTRKKHFLGFFWHVMQHVMQHVMILLRYLFLVQHGPFPGADCTPTPTLCDYLARWPSIDKR